jgi:hypothetical protein
MVENKTVIVKTYQFDERQKTQEEKRGESQAV